MSFRSCWRTAPTAWSEAATSEIDASGRRCVSKVASTNALLVSWKAFTITSFQTSVLGLASSASNNGDINCPAAGMNRR